MSKNTSKGGKSLKSLAPDTKQKPGGAAGPDSKIKTASVLMASGTNLMTGMNSYRGKGGK